MTNSREESASKNTRVTRDSTYKPVRITGRDGFEYSIARMGEKDFFALCPQVWGPIRRKRLQIDDFKCQKCGTPFNLQIHHHRYPEIWGEEDVENDLMTLCGKCHSEIHGRSVEEGDGPV